MRVHPDSVDIVAANKGRDTEKIEIGPIVWENRLAESYDLTGDVSIDQENQTAVEDLISKLGATKSIESSGGFAVWRRSAT